MTPGETLGTPYTFSVKQSNTAVTVSFILRAYQHVQYPSQQPDSLHSHMNVKQPVPFPSPGTALLGAPPYRDTATCVTLLSICLYLVRARAHTERKWLS